MKQLQLSILDLAIITEGGNAATAIKRTVEAAQHVEKLGFKRIWLAEHHNMENIASSATSVLIGHVAENTRQIRVGSGGIMLPNHSPLAIAEQFGTLESMYPGRIDLGLGRAPGTDQLTAMALRRSNDAVYNFPKEIQQLQTYFSAENRHARVRAFPGEGADIPIWILGSSTDSAYLAAEMGLPYAFAAHFAPAQFRTAINIYRRHFKPSAQLQQPYVLACVNVIAADTDKEAQFLATSLFRMFTGIVTNMRRPMQPPVESMEPYWNEEIKAALSQMLACTFIGGREKLKQELHAFVKETEIDELMTTTNMYDEKARLYSLDILHGVFNG